MDMHRTGEQASKPGGERGGGGGRIVGPSPEVTGRWLRGVTLATSYTGAVKMRCRYSIGYGWLLRPRARYAPRMFLPLTQPPPETVATTGPWGAVAGRRRKQTRVARRIILAGISGRRRGGGSPGVFKPGVNNHVAGSQQEGIPYWRFTEGRKQRRRKQGERKCGGKKRGKKEDVMTDCAIRLEVIGDHMGSRMTGHDVEIVLIWCLVPWCQWSTTKQRSRGSARDEISGGGIEG